MGLGNWALFLVAGDYMSQVAYWNFEDYIQNSGFKDKISNCILRPSSVIFPGPFEMLPLNYSGGLSFHGIRGSGAIIDSMLPSLNREYPQYSGYTPNLNFTGDFSFAFWFFGSETLKSCYNQSPRPEVASYFSIAKDNGSFSTNVPNNTFQFTANNSGNCIFSVINSGALTSTSVSQDGIDIGRWNFAYCEYDYTLSKIGISINGHNKTQVASSSIRSQLFNQSGQLNIFAQEAYWGIDELGFWNQKLDQEKILEYYHNLAAFSYSGRMDHQWVYPQGDISVGSPDDSGWFTGNPASGVPFGERWEYVNEAGHSYVYVGEFPAPSRAENVLYKSRSGPSPDVRIRFNTGKLFVRPSSVIANIDLLPDQVIYGGSGILKNILFYDKNQTVIASSIASIGITEDVFYAPTVTSQYMNVFPNNNWDLTETYMELTLSDDGNFYPGLAKANLLVSGQAIFETGLPLYESGSPLAFTLDLYEQGHINSSGRLDLYTAGHIAQDSGLSLYTYGTYVYNSSLPLYTVGYSTYSSGLDLYVNGNANVSGYVPLFINGISLASGYMPLFIKNEPISNSGDFPLFIYGSSGDPVVFGGRPLYLEGNDNLSTYSTMSLFTKGPLSGVKYESLPLFLDSNTRVASSVDLFLKNAYVESGRQLRLFIQGDGTLDGGLPYTGTMPLYIERIEGSERGLSMFLQANDGVNSGLPLYLEGGTYASSGLNLYTTSYDRPSGLLKLYTCGY